MGSFADITSPVSVPYNHDLGWNVLGYQVDFLGPANIPNNRIVNNGTWSRVAPTVMSGNAWNTPKKVYVQSGGEWKPADTATENPNLVKRVRMLAGYSIPAQGECPGSRIYFNDDGGANLNLPFPYVIPGGWRLTKFRSINGHDDRVKDIRFQYGTNDNGPNDFQLAGLDTTTLENRTAVAIRASVVGGIHVVHLYDKYSPLMPHPSLPAPDRGDCGGYLNDNEVVQKKLGSRFPDDIDAAFPIIPRDIDRIYLRGKNGGCSNCETVVYLVYMEFHSGNAVTNDGGETWTAPPIPN
jgi:hypothetical protein